MPFKDYAQVAEPLELPINGKTYKIPPVSLPDGIKLADVIDPDSDTTVSDEEFNRLLLGDALDEMRADHVTPAAINRATLAALGDWQKDRATAEIMWETGGDPKALEAWVKANTNRAQRRKVAGTTKPPVSGSSTKTPPQNS